MSESRIYEVVVIVAPNVSDDDLGQLADTLAGIVTGQGGVIVKNEKMGRRNLAYPIGKHKEGQYLLLEISGAGSEIAELERRMRVNDVIIRYMTVRVDLDRRRAEKLKARRARKAERCPGGKNVAANKAADE